MLASNRSSCSGVLKSRLLSEDIRERKTCLWYSKNLRSLSLVLFRMPQPSLALLLYLIALPLPTLPGQTRTGHPDATGEVTLSGAVNPRIRLQDDRGPVDTGRRLSQMIL